MVISIALLTLNPGVTVIICFVIVTGFKSVDVSDSQKLGINVVRFVYYVLFIKGSYEAITLLYKMLYLKQMVNWEAIARANKEYLYVFGASAAILVYFKESLFGEEFLYLFLALLVIRYLETTHTPSTIRYGIGMACSFFEGYLAHVIPSDGARFVGFEENISIYEANQGVVFPVKRLFIIITKSLYCPPDLKQFNKPNRRDLPYIEACESLSDVEKDVAGVKGRTYRNSAYKLHRPGLQPVYLAAECATPLHTLHLVLKKSAIFQELKNIDTAEVVDDFCTMLQTILSKSPECRNKCELVYYDDTNPELNLADILLDRIRELEPNFENLRRD